ncbi:MAG: DNA polymerase III subunit alpha [Hyphomonadaceae bacterium]|nr:DNA polymerase III subunit alpha [Hyphomonadaceae bacterium]
MSVAFAELCATTNFSFLRGASHGEELVMQAKALGLKGLGVADRNSLAGIVRAHAAAKEAKLKLAVGARLVFQDGTPDILVFPKDRAAYARLTRLLTLGNRRAPKGACWLDLRDLIDHCDGLQAIVAPVLAAGSAPDESLRACLKAVRERAGEAWLAARFVFDGEDRRRLRVLKQLAQETGARLIATSEPLHHVPERRALLDVLTCIREKTTLDAAGTLLAANGERHLKAPEEMARLYRDAPEVVAETAAFLDGIAFSLDELSYQYPDEVIDGYPDAQTALEALAWKGAETRYPNGVPQKVRDLLVRELGIIAQLKYAPYFLTVQDIVKFARSPYDKDGNPKEPILCQGRGSAANSTVCYCLGVTEVDPARFDLLFDRFVSTERNEPPDIDVDFEHERREEVIQYVYKKYGRHRAALAATLICYRGRSAIREVCKAFGYSEDRIAALSKTQQWWSKAVAEIDLKELGLDPRDGRLMTCLRLVQELRGFPRHLSQHVGGFVITREQLDDIVPIQNAAMEDRTVVEWDKDDLEELKILKVDLLGLGMLTCIKKAFDLVNAHYPNWARLTPQEEASPPPCGEGVGGGGRASVQAPAELSERRCVDSEAFGLADRPPPPTPSPQGGGGALITLTISSLPKEDPRVYAMLKRADSIGVFQVESRAQMSMLPRLRPECFYDLVIEVAIVRPGPIQGGMVHPYLKRRQGIEEVSYPSEALREVLKRTLGVPLFQEQAMQIAIVAAGFSPPEADKLRRAMATFRRVGTIGQLKEKFINGMIGNGYERAFAEASFAQIEGFGEYGFPESHAASFALLVYASSWLKCYFPDVFAAALLNAQPMGFYAPSEIVLDAIEHGVEARAPDVNCSDWDNSLEQERERCARDHLHERHEDMRGDVKSTHAVRMGFRQISGLAEEELKRLVERRGRGYDSVRDVWLRAGLSPATIEKLAEADAFRSLGLDRRDALWAARGLNRVGGQEDLPLFVQSAAPTLEPDYPLPSMLMGEHVVEDYRTIGLSLKAHPAALLRAELEARGVTRADGLPDLANDARVRAAGLVLVRQRPGTASGVIFMTLQDEAHIANIIVWPKVFEQFRAQVLGARLCAVDGIVQNANGVVHVVAERLIDFTPLLAKLSVADFANVPARADEVRRPGSDARQHPRKIRHDLRAESVMPKGRNFH